MINNAVLFRRNIHRQLYKYQQCIIDYKRNILINELAICITNFVSKPGAKYSCPDYYEAISKNEQIIKTHLLFNLFKIGYFYFNIQTHIYRCIDKYRLTYGGRKFYLHFNELHFNELGGIEFKIAKILNNFR